jgi:hypothetical protein
LTGTEGAAIEKEEPVQTVSRILLTTGTGLMVTENVKGFPKHPLVVGETLYMAVLTRLLLLLSV